MDLASVVTNHRTIEREANSSAFGPFDPDR